ncbi:hypothetical protein [Shewanella algae]|uniref:hypothetical protein n=1 Tax=Shewanella algae TaxID=38313 RepID=UPI001AAD3D2C|nr:hypothetical protein [Shewanella algae]MBO2701056.1 hypothetical protein [Shewanella algae]
MTIDQTISLAASIGACLSAIAAFLAVRQVSKQRESSYKPELVLSRTVFECSSNPLRKGNIPDTWMPRKENEEEKNFLRSFTMPLRNVGLGAAKSLKVTWSFPIESIVATVNEITQKSLIPAYFEYQNEMLSLKSEEMGGSTSMWGNQKNQSIDFVLPSPMDNAPVELALPHAYIQIVSALIHFSAKAEDFKSFPDIPPLDVDIEFSDIGGSQHKAKFSISTELISVSGKGEAFHGYVESQHRA